MRDQRALTAGQYRRPKRFLPRLGPSIDLIDAGLSDLPPPGLDASVNQRGRATDLEDIGSRDLESLDHTEIELIYLPHASEHAKSEHAGQYPRLCV